MKLRKYWEVAAKNLQTDCMAELVRKKTLRGSNCTSWTPYYYISPWHVRSVLAVREDVRSVLAMR